MSVVGSFGRHRGSFAAFLLYCRKQRFSGTTGQGLRLPFPTKKG